MTPVALPDTAPSLTGQVTMLLSSLAGTPPRGRLEILAVGHARQVLLRADQCTAPEWLPMPLLPLFESGDSLHVGIATRGERHGSLEHLAALVATFALHPVYEASAWRFPAARLEAVLEQLAGVTLPPTCLVLAATPTCGLGWRCVPLWALEQPLDVSTPVGEAAALAALQDVAAALEADAPPDDLRALTVQLPGSTIREWEHLGHVAEILQADPTRRYRLEHVLDALKER